MALGGVKNVLSKPRYLILAIVLAFLFAVLIYFFINMGFYGPLLTSRLPLVDKLNILFDMKVEMLVSFVTSLEGALLAIVSAMQGAALAVMIYVMRRNKKFDAQTVGSSGIAMFAAALGLGCVPCGTSLIMPIITIFFSSSAYAAANVASMVVLVIAFFLSIYSLYKLGSVAYMHAGIEKVEEESDAKK